MKFFLTFLIWNLLSLNSAIVGLMIPFNCSTERIFVNDSCIVLKIML